MLAVLDASASGIQDCAVACSTLPDMPLWPAPAAVDLQRVWLAAVSVGAAQFAADYALAYAKGRRQFMKREWGAKLHELGLSCAECVLHLLCATAPPAN